MVSKEELLESVNVMVTDPSANRFYEALVATLKVAHLPFKFTGEMVVLNPLLSLYREDTSAFQRVMEMIDNKREKRGWAPLKTTTVDFNRGEYQREFMHQKRAREKRAADIENMQRADRDKLIGTGRIEFIRKVSNQWKRRRDALLKVERDANGGAISREQMNTVLSRFWESIDAELDDAEAKALSKMRGW